MSVQLNIGVISLLLLFTSTAKAQSDVFDVVAEYGAKADEETDLRQVSKNAANVFSKGETYRSLY